MQINLLAQDETNYIKSIELICLPSGFKNDIQIINKNNVLTLMDDNINNTKAVGIYFVLQDNVAINDIQNININLVLESDSDVIIFIEDSNKNKKEIISNISNNIITDFSGLESIKMIGVIQKQSCNALTINNCIVTINDNSNVGQIIITKNNNVIKNKLTNTDDELIRGIEDIVNSLINKNILKNSDININLMNKIANRNQLRNLLK